MLLLSLLCDVVRCCLLFVVVRLSLVCCACFCCLWLLMLFLLCVPVAIVVGCVLGVGVVCVCC